jgi:hypothetical protein
MEKCSSARHPRSGRGSSPPERGTVYAKDSGSRVYECSPPESSHTASPLRTGLRWTPIRVHFHRGSPELDGLDTIKFAEPLLRAADGQTPLISEVPKKLCPIPALGAPVVVCRPH